MSERLLVTLTAEELRELVREAVRTELENTRDAEPAAMLSIAEAAALAKLHPRTIRKHVERGSLRASQIGRAWRVRRDDLEAFLAGGTTNHAA
jgi:excisionase family DNA binding protein